jgi:hypothetical protein
MFFRICLQGIVNKTFETFGLCAYKILVCLVLLASSSIPPAKAEPRLDLLLQEFDARPLSLEERRFLQLGLALTGYYNGTLDGKWGTISQEALTRYADKEFAPPLSSIYPRNIHAAALYFQVQEILDAHRWKLSYEDRFFVSIALPEGMLKVISNEPSEKIFGIAESDFTIKLMRHPETILEDIHGSFRFIFNEEPYQFREPALWVTGLDLKDGGGIYIRSDLVEGGWTSIVIRAPAGSETKLLTGIAASISPGKVEPWRKPTSGFLFGLSRLASVSFLNRNNRSIHSKADHPLKAFYGDADVKRFLDLVSKSKFLSALPEMQGDVDLCDAAVNDDGWEASEMAKVAELQFRGFRVIDCFQLLLATKLPKSDRVTFLWFRHPELKTMDETDLCVLATQRKGYQRVLRKDPRSEMYVQAALKRGLDGDGCGNVLLGVSRAKLLNMEKPPADSLFPKMSNRDFCNEATEAIDGSLQWQSTDQRIGVEVKLRSLQLEDCWHLRR